MRTATPMMGFCVTQVILAFVFVGCIEVGIECGVGLGLIVLVRT